MTFCYCSHTMTHLAIDYGSKHVGFALGDDAVGIASPFRIVENKGTEQLFDYIRSVITEEGIERVVVGMPLLGTSDTRQRQEVERFVEALTEHTTIPVYTYDESFTSQEAQQRLRDTGQKKDHAVAAMLILQSYFDSQQR